jgi:DMSO/TMAO reductase YedYZ molybdopterin-dependent catalytic subunit
LKEHSGSAVGNAEWTGVPLGALLERAGVEEDACEIVLEGADQGTPDIKPKPPLPISYARSLPRWKFNWLTPKKPGRYTLLAHARDAKGGAQPDKHDQNYDTYVIDHPLPIEVFVGPKNGN